MRTAEGKVPEASDRIDALMMSWQRQVGSAFDQELRIQLGAPPPMEEDIRLAGSGRIGQSRRSRKRRRR
jgi:hypothetical protein